MPFEEPEVCECHRRSLLQRSFCRRLSRAGRVHVIAQCGVKREEVLKKGGPCGPFRNSSRGPYSVLIGSFAPVGIKTIGNSGCNNVRHVDPPGNLILKQHLVHLHEINCTMGASSFVIAHCIFDGQVPEIPQVQYSFQIPKAYSCLLKPQTPILYSPVLDPFQSTLTC